ncbi:MAG: hypothetical protein ABJE47_09060 [bacterium]
MSLASVGSTAVPASAAPAAPASTTKDTEAVSNGFAAMLAGAVTPQAQATTAKPDVKAASEVGDDAGTELAGAAKKDDATTETPASPDVALAVLGAAATGLNPVLQTKLARVIERMHTEFGRDVKLVEGVRSQARQNQLFSQGRDSAGPVVTWTRNSQHTAGRAADLVINGGYDDATGFALLRQVAEQEGLHTLGAKDPGHVELRGAPTPADTAAARSALAQSGDTLSGTASPAFSRENLIVATGSMGRVASPAAVASVANVARVATVARVAQVGAAAAGAAAKAAAPAPTAVKSYATTTPIAAPAGKSGGETPAGNGESSTGAGGDKQEPALRRTGRADVRVEHGSERGADAYRALDGSREANGLTDKSGTDALTDARATTASRVSRLMDVQDAPGPRSLSHITLSLDDGNGGQDSVRVGMRGTSVGATFDMSNASSADRVSARLGELSKALEQRGLEPQAFQVRATSTAREADTSRATTIAPSAQRTVADTAATRNDSHSAFNGGDARQRFSHQSDQQEQAQRRQENQRRHGYSFSLTSEDQ